MTERCGTCGHSPATRNNSTNECSHTSCPHRKSLTASWGGDMHGDTAPADMVCMICLRTGHYSEDCPQERKRRARQGA